MPASRAAVMILFVGASCSAAPQPAPIVDVPQADREHAVRDEWLAEKQLTDFGRQCVTPSTLIARGSVTRLSKISPDREIATVAVDERILDGTEIRPDGGARSLSVSCPLGTLAAGEGPTLFFLSGSGTPGRVYQFEAAWKGNYDLLSALATFVLELRRIETLPRAEQRIDATAAILIETLQSPHDPLRRLAMREIRRWVDRRVPFFHASDAAAVERVAAQSSEPSQVRALRELARSMREGSSRP